MKPIDPSNHDDAFLRTLAALNGSITSGYASDYRAYEPQTLAILCSDARVPTTRLLGGHSYFVMRTAGNLYDPQAELVPAGLRQAVVIGHEAEGSRGCGGCDAARRYRADPGRSRRLYADTPELWALVRELEPDVEDNVRSVCEVLRHSGLFEPSRVFGMLYSHITGRVAVLKGMRTGEPTDDVVRCNAAALPGFGPILLGSYETADLREPQQPIAIVVNSLSGQLGRSFGHFFPSAGRSLLQANFVFEAKSPTARLTDYQLASTEFALRSALTSDASFSSTRHCFVLANSTRQLSDVLDTLEHRNSFTGFIERGGRAYGLVPSSDMAVTFFAAD